MRSLLILSLLIALQILAVREVTAQRLALTLSAGAHTSALRNAYDKKEAQATQVVYLKPAYQIGAQYKLANSFTLGLGAGLQNYTFRYVSIFPPPKDPGISITNGQNDLVQIQSITLPLTLDATVHETQLSYTAVCIGMTWQYFSQIRYTDITAKMNEGIPFGGGIIVNGYTIGELNNMYNKSNWTMPLGISHTRTINKHLFAQLRMQYNIGISDVKETNFVTSPKGSTFLRGAQAGLCVGWWL
ncbi:MAG: hypothetical protein RL660_2472 [Bacteroidota bacterium]|jgi:hypothetical protein